MVKSRASQKNKYGKGTLEPWTYVPMFYILTVTLIYRAKKTHHHHHQYMSQSIQEWTK